MRFRVGAVTIGQTPRPDLLAPLVQRAGARADVIEEGALDGMPAVDLPGRDATRVADGGRAYPLTTRLRDGTSVILDEADLAPLVQAAIDRVEAAGADATLLLCAGGFAGATARRILVRPFDAAVARLRELGARRVAIVVPFASQADPARQKWTAEDFEPTVLAGDLASVQLPENAGPLDAIVLDYVGHPTAAIDALRRRTSLPVVDLGEAGADAVVVALDASANRNRTAQVAGR